MISSSRGTRYMVTSGSNYYATEAEARAAFQDKDREAYDGIAEDVRDMLGM